MSNDYYLSEDKPGPCTRIVKVQDDCSFPHCECALQSHKKAKGDMAPFCTTISTYHCGYKRKHRGVWPRNAA